MELLPRSQVLPSRRKEEVIHNLTSPGLPPASQPSLTITMFIGRTTSGFIVGPSYKIAQPVTNSYNNTGLTAGTTYYYRVSTTNDAELEGIASTEVSGLTTGAIPTLLLHLDGNLTDSSGNANIVTNGGLPGSGNGYQSPGKFGASGIKLNTPTDNVPTTVDMVHIADSSLIQMNLSVGFSLSFWIWPTDITAA